MEMSDAYGMHVYDICGLAAIANLKKQQCECRSCHNIVQISQIWIPYADKLFQEYVPPPRSILFATPSHPFCTYFRIDTFVLC